MASIARVIAAGIPHHVTQRGNRRMPTFFQDEDYLAYITLLAEWCTKSGVEIWAYCLMPNHVTSLRCRNPKMACAEGLVRRTGVTAA